MEVISGLCSSGGLSLGAGDPARAAAPSGPQGSFPGGLPSPCPPPHPVGSLPIPRLSWLLSPGYNDPPDPAAVPSFPLPFWLCAGVDTGSRSVCALEKAFPLFKCSNILSRDRIWVLQPRVWVPGSRCPGAGHIAEVTGDGGTFPQLTCCGHQEHEVAGDRGAWEGSCQLLLCLF